MWLVLLRLLRRHGNGAAVACVKILWNINGGSAGTDAGVGEHGRSSASTPLRALRAAAAPQGLTHSPARAAGVAWSLSRPFDAVADGVRPRDVRFTRREVREAISWGDTQLKIHLSRLESLEYLLVRRDGTRFLYELACAGEGEAGTPFVMGLLDVEALRGQRYDDERSGPEGERGGVAVGRLGAAVHAVEL